MAGTLTETLEDTALDAPWNVLVHDDPVNLMPYVTWVLMKIFSYPENRAAALMMTIHRHGRAIVWSGEREQAEFFAQQLQARQLKSSIERTE